MKKTLVGTFFDCSSDGRHGGASDLAALGVALVRGGGDFIARHAPESSGQGDERAIAINMEASFLQVTLWLSMTVW